ncbi:hypothetical protein MN032_10915 [Agromyces atrinae]|uniref:hypothetical protein n=1 Tax=Agromyces atrinae TaxID=592376 RepID=UPI001F565908|nr:hypothetical protein [Agromyces atrinae]MCI2958208.1 hypothetical protein [Agromyces atrinae]
MSERAPELSAEEKALAVRMGIHDEDPTVSVPDFMMRHSLDLNDFRELLREFRSESGHSPWELFERDTLSTDFLNWFDWERLA